MSPTKKLTRPPRFFTMLCSALLTALTALAAALGCADMEEEADVSTAEVFSTAGTGRQDYIVIWNSGGKRQLATYIANGNGTFQEYVNTSSRGDFIPDTTRRDFGRFADVTGDGRQDYVVIWNSGGKRQLATYIANENGTFQEYVNTSSRGDFIPDTTGRDLGAFADVTGDGRQDYVVIWSSGGKRQLATYVANGNGTFREYVNTSSRGDYIPNTTGRDVGALADVTGDGRPDYVVIWNSGGKRQLATYIANWNGTFQEYINTASQGDYIPDTTGRDDGAFADVTGDGREDYLVIWSSGGKRQLATYIANWNGTFQEYVNTASRGDYIPDATRRDLGTFADVTGDGRQDYTVIWDSGGKRQLATYIANWNGTFQEYANTASRGDYIPDATRRDLGAFADVTGDGRQDYMVIWNSGGKRQLATYVANGNGTFQEYVNTSSRGDYIPDATGRDLGAFADVAGR